MIRDVPTGARFTFRRRMGDATSLLATSGIGAAVSLASTGLSLWMNSIQLSHDADSATTAIVNGLASQLDNLSKAYFAEANPTCADQRAALDSIDAAILWLQSPQACGNPAYGAAGNRCISERAFPGAKYSYVDQIRTPIANDPRLANAGCDTGTAVYLPNVQTGYASTGITSTGGSSTTGQTAAQIAAQAVAATSLPAASSSPLTSLFTDATGAPNYVLIGAAALGAVLLMKAL